MKKENKKLAQKRRAKQRRQQKIKNIIGATCKIGLPVLAFLVVVGLIVLWPSSNETPETEEQGSTVIIRDSAFVVKKGDKVNIDFVAYIDDKEVDGWNTNGQGTDLTIGSKAFIDGFEDQLIGAHIQDDVDVNVTFPDDYGDEKMKGKAALFKVKINAIYMDKKDVPEREFVKDASLEIKKGNTINLDFVGTINGEEFEGGNTKGEGTDLVVGSGMYIDGFEEQLYGAHPGDTIDVKVTFPKDYDEVSLREKEAVFKVTINGIYKYKVETSK